MQANASGSVTMRLLNDARTVGHRDPSVRAIRDSLQICDLRHPVV
jgi:hypothetical protein